MCLVNSVILICRFEMSDHELLACILDGYYSNKIRIGMNVRINRQMEFTELFNGIQLSYTWWSCELR